MIAFLYEPTFLNQKVTFLKLLFEFSFTVNLCVKFQVVNKTERNLHKCVTKIRNPVKYTSHWSSNWIECPALQDKDKKNMKSCVHTAHCRVSLHLEIIMRRLFFAIFLVTFQTEKLLSIDYSLYKIWYVHVKVKIS